MNFLKDCFAELVIGIAVTILAIAIAFTITGCANAEITGAVGCNAGHLTILTSDKSAVWSVYPAEYSTSYAVSEDGKTLYFASPKAGKVTFFAASVVDGQPYLEQHSLYNGLELPEPTPTPAPVPIPVTLEDFVKEEATGKDAAELTALAESLEFVVDGVDRGTIKTPTAARETFRAVWADKGTKAKETALDDLSELVDVIGKNVDNSTVKSLRDDYEAAAKAIRSCIPAKESVKEVTEEVSEEEEAEAEPETKLEKQEPEKKAPAKDCPNGQCPTGTCPNTTPQRRFYWSY